MWIHSDPCNTGSYEPIVNVRSTDGGHSRNVAQALPTSIGVAHVRIEPTDEPDTVSADGRPVLNHIEEEWLPVTGDIDSDGVPSRRELVKFAERLCVLPSRRWTFSGDFLTVEITSPSGVGRCRGTSNIVSPHYSGGVSCKCETQTRPSASCATERVLVCWSEASCTVVIVSIDRIPASRVLNGAAPIVNDKESCLGRHERSLCGGRIRI